MLTSFGPSINAAVFGASGGIGGAFVQELLDCSNVAQVDAFSRRSLNDQPKLRSFQVDVLDEDSLKSGLEQANKQYELILVALGLLHDDQVQPEKALKQLSFDAMQRVFALNAFAPMIIAKHTLPRLPRERRSAFAALSARVGSIADNRLGGWYAYRASKTALNQFIKTTSIEHARRWPEGLVVGLHPGTVDTGLSKPFQSQVSQGKLFTPSQSARKLLKVLDQLQISDSGQVFDHAGQAIPA